MLDLIPLLAGVILAQIAPGPNLMAVSANALAGGRSAGLATAAAIALGNGIWAVLFAIGIGAFLEAFPVALSWLSLAGGAYLVYLGLRSIAASFRNRRGNPAGGPGRSARAAFRHGLIVNLTNPKAAFLWVAVTVYLAGLGASEGQMLAAAGAVIASSFLVYGGYGLLFSTGVAMRAYRRFFRWIERLFGAIFGALGARLMIDGAQGLRG